MEFSSLFWAAITVDEKKLFRSVWMDSFPSTLLLLRMSLRRDKLKSMRELDIWQTCLALCKKLMYNFGEKVSDIRLCCGNICLTEVWDYF